MFVTPAKDIGRTTGGEMVKETVDVNGRNIVERVTRQGRNRR
jgi:hypothetical protein